MRIDLDLNQINALANRLRAADRQSAVEARRSIARSGVDLKRAMAQEATGSQHFPGIPASIGYDLTFTGDTFELEVGPEIGRGQGSLAFIPYEGTPVAGPSFPDPQHLAEAEALVLGAQLESILEIVV